MLSGGWIGRGRSFAAVQRDRLGPFRDRFASAGFGVDPCIGPPVFMGLGVIIFMTRPAALPVTVIMLLIAGTLGLRLAARRRVEHLTASWALALLAWGLLGWGAAAWRVDRAAAPVLPEYERGYDVAGWVSRVDPGRRPGVVIEVTAISGVDAAPERIRVRTPRPAPSLGAGVSGRMSLTAPPGPATPGGYDFSRRAWFDGIGGTGFTYGRMDAADVETRGWQSVKRRVSRIRGRLADRIRDAAPTGSGAIIAALLTGERSGIDNQDAEALRASGLGHLLAISGLHMALVGGGVFFVVSLSFALIQPLARRYDIRKPAAMAAIVASAVYLVISGAPVSAQRAFIMLLVAFLALIFDRRALTLRNVAVAAVIVLFFTPEALLEAGFQMSFSAAAALVAAFDFARERGSGRRLPAPIQFFSSLSATSLVAGAATAAFAAFHFNRWAAYGLFANLAAMPFFTLWVMPAAVIGLALTPIGLDGVFYRLAASGMDVVLAVGGKTAEAPHALAFTAAGPGWALGVYSAGFILLVGGRRLARVLGLLVMAAAGLAWSTAPKPFLWISDQGVVAVREGDELYASSLRRSRYGVDQFSRRLGQDPEKPVHDLKARMNCDADACVGQISGMKISLIERRRSLKEECRQADLVIFEEPAAARSAWLCRGELYDAVRLNRAGGVAYYRKGGGYQIKTARESRWKPPKP